MEEPALGPGPQPLLAAPPSPCPGHDAEAPSPPGLARGASGLLQLRTGSRRDTEPVPNSRQQACNGGVPSGVCEGTPSSQTDSRGHPRAQGHPPMVRVALSEGLVPSEPLGARQTLARPPPARYSDATSGDPLWQPLEPGGHGGSVSSSSSLSSSDTVIDLSLPGLNLGRKSLSGALAGRLSLRPCLASAAQPDLLPVTKSQSNPNLRAAGPAPVASSGPRPRPLAPRPPCKCLPLASLQDCTVAAKSKSLGDLTADDFAPRNEGLGRRLGRHLGPTGQGPVGRGPRRDALTEQLRWLTGFQQAGDITSPTSLGPGGGQVGDLAGGPGFPHSSSSRSRSRVRAIASRARQAQERQQRLQGPWGPPEERGAPEGACSEGQDGFGDAPAPTRTAAGLLLRL